MGFSVSGSTAIIFLGVLVASGTLYTGVSHTTELIQEAQDEREDRLKSIQNTAIEITKADYNETNDSLYLEVTNEGATSLSISETTLLVDNTYVSLENHTTVEGMGDTNLWGQGETLLITADQINETPTTVKIVSKNGIGDLNSTVS